MRGAVPTSSHWRYINFTLHFFPPILYRSLKLFPSHFPKHELIKVSIFHSLLTQKIPSRSGYRSYITNSDYPFRRTEIWRLCSKTPFLESPIHSEAFALGEFNSTWITTSETGTALRWILGKDTEVRVSTWWSWLRIVPHRGLWRWIVGLETVT
jgi:hypothetical protein